MIQHAILVCDSDPVFLEQLAAPVAQGTFLTASTPAQAQHLIADRHSRISSICIHSRFCNPAALPLLRFTRYHRPTTPIFFLYDEETPLPGGMDFSSLTVTKAIQKPITPQELADQLIPSAHFDLGCDRNNELTDDHVTGSEAAVADSGMHPIDVESFLCGAVVFFDVFVRLGPQKYVKILKAHDPVDPEWVACFLRKGVRYFYIHKEAQLVFLNYCDQIMENILKRKDVSLEVKQRQLANLGQETYDFLRCRGISEASLFSAQRFVKFSHQLASELRLTNMNDLAAMIGKLRGSSHTIGTIMILSMILDALEFKDESVIQTIALGAFLHDVGLELLPENLRHKSYDDLSPEERLLFEQHPTLGADALLEVPHLSPLVIQVVRQHHERRNRRGYPGKLGVGAISPAAELTGIADTFHRMIERSGERPEFDPIGEIQSCFDDFSFQAVYGFRRAFRIGK